MPNYQYTYICTWGGEAAQAVYYASGDKNGNPKDAYKPDAVGQVLVAGDVAKRPPLKSCYVEGQLFSKFAPAISNSHMATGTSTQSERAIPANTAMCSSECELQSTGSSLGAGWTVWWMIDDSSKTKKGDLVGRAVVLRQGTNFQDAVSKPKSCVVPVWAADGEDMGTTDTSRARYRMYYFQNNYNDMPSRSML